MYDDDGPLRKHTSLQAAGVQHDCDEGQDELLSTWRVTSKVRLLVQPQQHGYV